MQKEVGCDNTMSSRPRPQSSAMRGARMRNIIIIVVFSCVLCLLYLYNEANHKWTNFQYESEKCQQRRDSLSAQLQVTYEHKGRLDKALQEEKALHAKTMEEFYQFKQMQQSIRERDQESSLKRINSLLEEVSTLQNQNEDLRGENNQLNKKNINLLNEAKQIENDYKTQIQQKDMQIHSLRASLESANADKVTLERKVSELTQTVKSIMQGNDQQKHRQPEVDEANVNANDTKSKQLPANMDSQANNQKALNAAEEVQDSYIQKLAQSNSLQKQEQVAVSNKKDNEEQNNIQKAVNVVNAVNAVSTEGTVAKFSQQINVTTKDNPLPPPPPNDNANEQFVFRPLVLKDNDRNDNEIKMEARDAHNGIVNNVINSNNIAEDPNNKDHLLQHPLMPADSIDSHRNVYNRLDNKESNDIDVNNPLNLNHNQQFQGLNDLPKIPLNQFEKSKEGDQKFKNEEGDNQRFKNEEGDNQRFNNEEDINNQKDAANSFQNIQAKDNQHEEGEYEDDAAEEQDNKNDDDEYSHNNDQEKIQEERNKRFREWNQRQIDHGENMQDVEMDNQPSFKKQNFELQGKEHEDREEQVDSVMVAPH